MSAKRLILFFCIFILAFSGSLPSQELLKTNDINKVMEQIFAQHVEEKNISPAIIKHAFRIYIDQFDPYRTYLLDEEVAPFLGMSDAQVAQVIEQYHQQNYAAFVQLNATIQKAIERSRKIRAEVEQDRSALFAYSPSTLDPTFLAYEDPDLKVPFASSPQELKERFKQRLIHFIMIEKRHFGDDPIMRNQERTLTLYESHLRLHEDSYLFRDAQDRSLAPAQTENLFVIHVLKALAGSLDAHTTFYDNAEAYDLKIRLEKAFEGIGVVLQQGADGSVVISHLVKGGPADKSQQIMEQDHIVSIDGKNLSEVPFEKVSDLIRGKHGSNVTLVLKRTKPESKVVEVTLQRAPIAVDEDRVDVSSEKFGNGIIGRITLHSFYQGESGISSEKDMRQAIKDLSSKGPLKGLILDMRDNSGGFLGQAIKVAGLFIKSGVVVISKYSDGHETYYRDMDGKATYQGPLVILTSKATASAAEIVAQALQDYGVGIVIGDERTYGKGTIQSQTVTDSAATSYFKVTVGKYYTVSGKTPQIRGVQADILVPGPYNFEHLGEQFLEYSLPNDQIKPEYKDDLADVDPGLRAWYLRYYIPTLQPKVTLWRSFLPTLQKNSTERLSANKEYQNLLNQWKQEASSTSKNLPQQQDSAPDLQTQEAMNILKDMILLQAHEREANAFPPNQPFTGPNGAVAQ